MRIRVFDETFELEGVTDSTFFRDYICNDNHGYRIRLSDKDFFFEKMTMESYLISHKQETNEFSDTLIYRLAVLRKIAEYSPNRFSFLFHGSAISYKYNGILFCAKSGIGKSTHSKLWKEYFGDQVIHINDDKPFLKQKWNEILIYGSPWDGKHHLSNNISRKLKAVCIIQRDTSNSVRKMSKDDALTAAYQWIYHPKNEIAMIKTFEFADCLSKAVPFYTVNCNMSPDAAITCYEGIKESLNETE